MGVGILQTADYARHTFTWYAELHPMPDVEDAVRALVRRQEILYEPGRSFDSVVWDSALHARACPPQITAAHLNRLAGVVGLDTMHLGIVPFSAPLALRWRMGSGYTTKRLVIAEDCHPEL